MDACLSEQQLRDLAAGNVDPADEKVWRQHLESCEECQKVLREWEQDLAYLAELRHASAGGLVSINTPADWHSEKQPEIEPRQEPEEPIPGYRILREIHRGGQGIVFQAIQESTNRKVAVKVLLDGVLAGRRARERFEREVRLVAGLSHPNIVAVHDSGLAQNRHFYAMDYIRGLPLDEYVRFKALSVRDIIRLLIPVCDAVRYAHGRGVIHRDLKPSNLLVTDEGTPFVLDFGLAKRASASDGEQLSRTGHMLGTLRYMSPEQTLGNHNSVDTRTDVYAIGVILYELLTEQAPYDVDGDLSRSLRNIREVDPPRPSRFRSGVNSELDAIVMKAMEKDPARRYYSAHELREDLLAWVEGRPVNARSASSLYLLSKVVAKHGFETIVLTALVLAVAGFGGVAADQHWQASRARDQQKASDASAEEARQAATVAVHAELLPGMRHLAFFSFLLEWHQDRIGVAREMQRRMSPGSSEARAAAFLLDDSMTVEQLRTQLEQREAFIADFAAGERAARQGRIDLALQHYRACSATESGNWLRASAQARMDQILARAVTTTGNGSGGN